MCAVCERWKARMVEAKDPSKKRLLAKLFYYHRQDPRYHTRRK
jgi:hypothetical protein